MPPCPCCGEPGAVRAMLVASRWQCRGSGAGMGTSGGRCPPRGYDGSGLRSAPKWQLLPLLARARLCLRGVDEAGSPRCGGAPAPRDGGPGVTHSGPLQSHPGWPRAAQCPGLLEPGGGCAGGSYPERGDARPAAALPAALVPEGAVAVLQAQEGARSRLATSSRGGAEPGPHWHMWREERVRDSLP